MADNIVIKILSDTKELKDLQKELKETGKLTEDQKKRFEELQRATTLVDKSMLSLKAQIKEAKNEAQILATAFGENSAQANKAAQRVANLTEELGDFNQRVNALNPEAKFNALNQVVGGTIGAFQGLTGAIQLFGGESEEVQKIAAKLQGFLNLTQGLNSVLGLKDAFSNLRVVLTAATASTTSLAVATEGVAVAEGAATVGATNFGIAFTAATGGVLLLIAGVIAAFVALENQLNASIAASERLKKKFEDQDASRLTFDKRFKELSEERLANLDFEIKKAEALGATEKEIISLKIKRLEVERAINNSAIASDKLSDGFRDQLIKQQKELRNEIELLNIAYSKIIDTFQKQPNIPPLKIAEIQLDSDKIVKELQDQFDNLEPIKVNIETKKAKQRNLETDIKEIEDAEKQKQEIALNLSQGTFDLITGLSRNATESQIQDLDLLLAKKEISEDEYQKKVKEIRRKQAQDEKSFAIFQILLNTASAIVKQLSLTPLPAGAPLVAAIAAISAAQLAVVASKPIPKFKRGTLNVTGGQGGEDDVLSYLNRGEAVIPTDRNRDYSKTIAAIFNRTVSAQDLNNFVVNKTSGGNHINATINPYDLARGLKRSKREIESQARIQGRVIARELSSAVNLRNG
jgi:hypothetical protein